MKFVRFGRPGAERPGLVDSGGRIRDLSAIVPDITGAALGQGLAARVAGVSVDNLPLVPEGTRLGPCLGNVGNFIAIGLNYADHATETGAAIPKEPILFNKARSCIVGPNDDVVLPPDSVKSDWEVELAFVMSKTASYVSEADALSHVGGYFICNDVSEREYQLEREGQWMKGKCCPTFGPIGPWLVTPDEVGDPQDLALWLEVNGERVQNGSTRTMIFPIARLVADLSRYMILEPGDIVTTGTPPGVGLGMKPPRFLKRGDTMRLGIEKLGEQQQRVV
ncbi:fumarylacetoacetate hydrolase family protein [Azospirillum sp. RWY-5-1]|uniref:Fumarylacetoacetate hydrolase family protein n=1 Tax=Azospirillum oleiclasticum TaxID=2735135 RepID=A0ABX2TMY3_9PROT|nr:fumarylacetoacetate hydrolase family protein [Azospirillum oleiclasticum]NYZ17639.1 fumarylacetoacetate hydrolase family protein [Azospirillum oleiclasticum]NYZ24994.1 fumarylacetoacetate hydrolase family protein [Azospirillum oleiclasticum]